MIQTGVFSYGMSGKIFHAPFIHYHPQFNLFAVCERNTKKASIDYPKIRSFNSIDSLLRQSELDLVVINTPNNTHFEYGIQALRAGKHIIVEKPFTITLKEAETLFTEADKQKKQVFVYQNRRYDSDFAVLKQVVESGKLGTIHEVHFRFDRFKDGIGPKKFKETPQPGAGIIYDLGPHLLDQAICIFGHPKSWNIHKNFLRKETQVEDFAILHLQYEHQLQLFITLSMQTMGKQPAYVLHGSHGSLYKNRSDVQETQLIAGILPNAENFAQEGEADIAILSARHPALVENIDVTVPSPECSYMNFYDDVAKSLLTHRDFPIKRDDILKQIEILESTL